MQILNFLLTINFIIKLLNSYLIEYWLWELRLIVICVLIVIFIFQNHTPQKLYAFTVFPHFIKTK
jgi:hypothetical protein